MSVFDMGTHGFYVWTSYGVSFAVLVFLVISPFKERKKLIKGIHAKRIRMEQRQEDVTSAP
jgi:heme exporter protein D